MIAGEQGFEIHLNTRYSPKLLASTELPVSHRTHAMPGPEYQIQTASDGMPQITHCNRGNSIPIAPNDQSYCDFLTWASRQSPRPDQYEELEDAGYFFAETERLVEHLKNYGHMLYVERKSPDSGSEYEVPRRNSHHKQRVPGGRFYRLFRAAELPRNTARTYTAGIAPEPLNVWVAEGMLVQLNGDLLHETSAVRCISTWPVTRCFVYIDISDFSKYEPGQQALVINALTSITRNSVYWKATREIDAVDAIEAQLCIGDGYIICFTDTVLATYYAARLAEKIEVFVAQRSVPVEFHFRIGIHVGEVYRFWDIGRENWNYVGDGINGGNRVLAAIGKDTDDVVYLSHQVRAAITAPQFKSPPYRDLLNAMLNRGRRSDKHGRMWRVYELGHAQVPE